MYPADLERILDECEAIAEAAVVGCPDAETGEALVACVVLKEGHWLSSDQVKALFEGRLASYQHPRGRSVHGFAATYGSGQGGEARTAAKGDECSTNRRG